jgi:branched-chain amino acid transport system ATP-binding protein
MSWVDRVRADSALTLGTVGFVARGSKDRGKRRVALLEVELVRVEFGGIVALDDLSFALDAGHIGALIGPNGAGKTTLFNCVSRVYQPKSGAIRFDGHDLLALPAHKVAQIGVARTFQNLALFPSLSVVENVMTGAHSRGRVGPLRAAFRVGAGGEENRLRVRALDLLDRLDLAQFASRPAAGLPFGTLKRLEIARALAAEPKLLLLDEPAAGLTHGEVDELGATIRRIRDDFALTVLLVEHHMSMVMAISDHVVVLNFGREIAAGSPTQVSADPQVIEAYLGAPA